MVLEAFVRPAGFGRRAGQGRWDDWPQSGGVNKLLEEPLTLGGPETREALARLDDLKGWPPLELHLEVVST